MDGNTGTLEQISFVRSRTIIQILRLSRGHGSSIRDYETTDSQKHTVLLRAGGI